MSLKWLIQDTSRNFSSIQGEVEPLKELGFEINTFGRIPFTDTITGIEDLSVDDFYILRCGTKVVDLVSSGKLDVSPDLLDKLRMGLSYDKVMFDQANYSSLDLPLLNSSPEILDLSKPNNLMVSFSKPMFVKPSSDLKAFSAGIIEPGQTIRGFIEQHYYQPEYNQETALIHDVINIKSEYRFICLNGEVIGASRYHLNGSLNISEIVPEKMLSYGREFAKMYKPSEIYTMDLAETDDGVKIVEYNCWNASGLYSIDAKKMFAIIHEYYENKFL